MGQQEKSALHVATLSGWYRFEQNGRQWIQVERALTYWSITCLAVDSEDPHLVYAGTGHSGLFFSRNGGRSWKRADPNVPRLMLLSLLALPQALLVGTVPAGLYRSAEGGWREIEEFQRLCSGARFPPNPELGSRTRCLARDPSAPGRLYAGIEVGGLLVSDDAGLHWSPVNRGPADRDVHQVAACAKTPGLLVAACGEGIFRSLNRGNDWEEVTPSGPRTYGMAVTEDQDGVIYLGIARGRPNTWLRPERADAAILRSKDRGATWEAAVEGLAGAVMALSPIPDGEGVIAGTSEGNLISIDSSGCEILAERLPCIAALALGA